MRWQWLHICPASATCINQQGFFFFFFIPTWNKIYSFPTVTERKLFPNFYVSVKSGTYTYLYVAK